MAADRNSGAEEPPATPTVDAAFAMVDRLRERGVIPAAADEPRRVTAQEDRWLREAAKRSSTLVAPSKLATEAPSKCEFPACAVHHICDRHCERNAGEKVPFEWHVCPRHDFDTVDDPKVGCPKCNAERAARRVGEADRG